MKIQYLRRLFSFILIIFLYLSSTGCSQDEKQPLRIASSPWPGFEPLYLARDLGYLDKNKTKLFELPSLDITMESFRNRSADLATLTLDEVLELLLYGTKLRILLIMDISNGGDAVLAKPEIKNIEEIKGKRISIVNVPLGLY
ncbi:MAG: nitrate/sulfonate/bicarbonate ABC transporter, partial [Gammaproteobacteria bacterium]|nr:nitrate/sulfonate/bicarbonate ABC transporter [Gammaproteobacteria bacterium]